MRVFATMFIIDDFRYFLGSDRMGGLEGRTTGWNLSKHNTSTFSCLYDLSIGMRLFW